MLNTDRYRADEPGTSIANVNRVNKLGTDSIDRDKVDNPAIGTTNLDKAKDLRIHIANAQTN